MNDIRFVSTAPGRGELYINGHKVSGVLAIDPNLFELNELASIKIELAVSTFTFEPKPA